VTVDTNEMTRFCAFVDVKEMEEKVAADQQKAQAEAQAAKVAAKAKAAAKVTAKAKASGPKKKAKAAGNKAQDDEGCVLS